MLNLFFPERLARFNFWWRGIVLLVAGAFVGHLGSQMLEARYATGLLHQYLFLMGPVVLLALCLAGARANDIRQKGGDDGMAHLGIGLPLAMIFCLLVLDEPPAMLQPKIMGAFTLVPLLSAVGVMTAGISVIAFFYLGCVGPKDPREQPVDVVMPRHPFWGVPAVLLLVMLGVYAFTLSVAHYKAPALRAAAEKGDAAAMIEMAEMYNEGITVKTDVPEAIKWLKRAIDKGSPQAHYAMAKFHEEGRGMPKDEAKAASWHLKSAQKGLGAAQLEIAQRYGMGKGVKRDYVQSYLWYSRAAHDYSVTAEAIEERTTIWELMTPGQRKQARRLAPHPLPPGEQPKPPRAGGKIGILSPDDPPPPPMPP